MGGNIFVSALCGFTSFIVFTYHSWHIYLQMSGNTRTLTYAVLPESPSFPAITICPPVPFDSSYLPSIGLNLTCELQHDCISQYERMEGLNLSKSHEDIYKEGVLPLQKLIRQVEIFGEIVTPRSPKWLSLWSISHTIIGPCWTLKVTEKKRIELSSTLKIGVISQIPCSKERKKYQAYAKKSIQGYE